MKDAMGQPLSEGDRVAYVEPSDNYLSFGTVMRFTPKNIRIMPDSPKVWNDEHKKGLLRYPSSVIKITEQFNHFAAEHPELLV